jgi:hypothetical protein
MPDEPEVSDDGNKAASDLLWDEIAELNRLQTEAIQRATYLGMTPAETKHYNERREKIMCLWVQLRTAPE